MMRKFGGTNLRIGTDLKVGLKGSVSPALKLTTGDAMTTRMFLTVQTVNTVGIFEYQAYGSKWLASKRRAILGDEPGLGKTVQALRASQGEPTIVVCPAMAANVWRAQAAKWTPGIRVADGGGRRPERGRIDLYSYDYRGPVPDVRGATVILDEIHYLRHPDIVRSMRWAFLSSQYPGETRIWGLTGTPVVSEGTDLEAILAAIGLKDAVVLRRTLADVDLQLPDRVYDTYPVTLSHDLYRVLSILDEKWNTLESDQLPPLAMMSEARAQIARAKIAAAMQWVGRHRAEPLVVYCSHLDPLHAIVAGRDDWAMLSGEQSIEERDAIIEAFDKGHLRGLACSSGAVGVAVSLVTSQRMLFIDRGWNPGDNEQVERRLCRIGAKGKHVFVTDLIADHPLERRVYEILERKRRDIEVAEYLFSE